MSQHRRELAMPPAASRDPEAAEILRCWVVDRGLHVSLDRAFDGPEVWGLLLADIARHASRAFAQDGIMSEAEALSRIKDMFDAEWGSPTDMGTTRPGRN